MTRFALIFAIFLTGTFVALVAVGQTRLETTKNLDADGRWNDKIGDMLVSYSCFESTMKTTIELLLNGEISLADGAARVHDSAARNHPDYLKFIELSDPAPTARERVARNLTGHLQAIERVGMAPSARVRAVELELAVLY